MPSEADKEQVLQALAGVRAAALGCTQCKLSASRTQVVFGTGNPLTPMALVGQSPGEQEDSSGEPFVGRAGQLLTECLQECGIKRRHVWITNIVKCRPWEQSTGGRGKNRDPESDEIEACRMWIEAELALVRPRVIVCIGGPSAELILGRKVVMGKDRGRFYTEHRFRPAHVIPVFHPAFLLRNHGAAFDELRGQFVEDLDSARKLAARLRHETPASAPPPEPENQLSLFDAAEAAGADD